ncbi:MAG: antibiotic biosynthesis monooxygenase [Thalassovita sp.]
MTQHHTVMVTLQPQPKHRSAFADVMHAVQKDLPSVEGCIDVRILTQQDSPDTFILIEDWTSADLHSAHIDRLVAAGDWANLEQMLAQAPSTVVLNTL